MKKTAYEIQDEEAHELELSNIQGELTPDSFLPFTILPPVKVEPKIRNDKDAIRKEIERNIGLVPTLRNCCEFILEFLDAFLKSPSFKKDKPLEDALLITATVEEVFWQRRNAVLTMR